MEVQIRESKSVTMIVFYVPAEKVSAAKEAVEEMKSALNEQGFVVDKVTYGVTRR